MEAAPASKKSETAILTAPSPNSGQVSNLQSIPSERQLSLSISPTSLPDPITSTDPLNAYQLAQHIQNNPSVPTSLPTTTILTIAMDYISALNAYESALMMHVSNLKLMRDEVKPLQAEIILAGRERDVSELLERVNKVARTLQTKWAYMEEQRSFEQHIGLLRDVIRILVGEITARWRERVSDSETEKIVEAIEKWKEEVLATKEERRREELLDETERTHMEPARPGVMPAVLNQRVIAECLRRRLVRTWWCRIHFVP